jgi:hypothetical protein
MTCEEFQTLAQALARDEGLDVATLESALTHADSCQSCDALLEEAESLTSDLRALAAHYSGEAAPGRVEAAVLRALQQQREPDLGGLQRWLWSASIAGVAAAIVLVLAITGRPKILWHSVAVVTASRSEQAVRSSGIPQASTGPRQVTPTATVDGEEGADSFVPLSGTFDLASLNEDPIVRVVLSSEDLQSLGLPIGDSDDEQVVADLIIANDGTPQAIRVVSW